MAFLNYYQGRVPHVTQPHGKMERLLHYLQANTSLEEDLLFCSEEGYNFKCPDKNWFASVIFFAHVTRGPKWTVTFFSDSLCNVLFVQWTFDLIDWHLKLINVYSHNLCSFSTQATFFNIDIRARLYCKWAQRKLKQFQLQYTTRSYFTWRPTWGSEVH